MSDLNSTARVTTEETVVRGGVSGWPLVGLIALAVAGGYMLSGSTFLNAGIALPPPPLHSAAVPVVGGDSGSTNWLPPVEPAGVVRPGKEAPPASELWGQNDPKGQAACDTIHQTFKGWVGRGAQRHAWCE